MKSTWTNPKYGKNGYTGSYQIAGGERNFVLTRQRKNGSFHNISFESFQAAKALGWKKK